MKKMIQLTLAITMIGNLSLANSQMTEDDVRKKLEIEISELKQKVSELEDKAIQDEIQKTRMEYEAQLKDIQNLNLSLEKHLDGRKILIPGAIVGAMSAITYAGLMVTMKYVRTPMQAEQYKAINLAIAVPATCFAAILISGLTNEYLIFDTREELVEFHKLASLTQEKLKMQIEALNQN